jgi:penicillin-binding protein 2
MSAYIRTGDRDWYKKRLNGGILCVIAAFSVLMARLFHLQVIEGEEYQRLSMHNCIRLRTVPASRGLIFDRHGELMVDNRPSFNLLMVLRDAAPVDETLHKLAIYAAIPEEELKAAIGQGRGQNPYKPVVLKEDISRDVLAAIEVNQYDLPGVTVDPEPKRFYVRGTGAAHLLGYIGEVSAGELADESSRGDLAPGDLVGKSGLERSMDRILRGKPGGHQVEVSATGQVVKVMQSVPAEPGLNLFLTIDHDLQAKAETLMHGLTGAVVAMTPSTGEVLALVSSPAFNPNDFVGGLDTAIWEEMLLNPHGPLENRAIKGEYPPASTYKIVTAIAGLEEGVIDEETEVFCPGYYEFGNRVFRCWKRGGHGTVNVVSAISRSCDVFFYQVGEKLGVDRMARYALGSGLGRATGIQLEREADGLIPTSSWKMARFGLPWAEGENLPIAIGQGYNLTTPLQMACLISAVGNNGRIPSPTIVQRIEDAHGQVQASSPGSAPDAEARMLPVSQKTLDLVREGLWRVVQGPKGTARGSKIEGIEFCGKTGTGQVIGRERGEENQDVDLPAHLMPHAWFVAYAPAESPRIAVAVIVENGEHGSSTAAPIARELIRMHMLPKSVPVENGDV